MNVPQETIAFWATILGTIISLVGLLQSRGLLTIVGVLCIGGAIGGAAFARNRHRIVESASITIEGRSIDSLNIANLRRRVNRSLFVQGVDRVATIRGQDLNIASQYAGYCRTSSAETIEFSIDTDNNVPFDHLNCFAYDLRNDPAMHHRIRPMLIGTDGNSKKVAVPFLRPLASQQAFRVLLICDLPGCMKSGVEYFAAALSFDQQTVEHASTKLIFIGSRPQWVRVYEANGSGPAKLLRDLPPLHKRPAYTEFEDVGENLSARSSRVYIFNRPEHQDEV